MTDSKKKLLTEDMPEKESDLEGRGLALNEQGNFEAKVNTEDSDKEEELEEGKEDGPRLLTEDL